MKKFKYNLLLLLAAAIWGFAFVAQIAGMEHVGPFTFNGIRFALGGLSLLPLMFFMNRKKKSDGESIDQSMRAALPAGIGVGAVLFAAASLQQIGLMYTTAGKAAFITCLYIVLVPIAGVALKRTLRVSGWIGAIIATVGLYFLCISGNITLSRGDALELAGAFCWTVHILLIDHYSSRIPVLKLAFVQFITCSVFSMGVAFTFEHVELGLIRQAAIPIIYGGCFSVGVAYTLQVICQKHIAPAPAAVIFSMETVFAVIGGFLLLHERLGVRELTGCGLMLAGMLLSQLGALKKPPAPNS